MIDLPTDIITDIPGNNAIDSPETVSAGVLSRVDVQWLTQFLTLTGVAIFLPFFIHLPWLTGPLVNAILILVLLLCGLRSAILVSFLPSLAALSGGLLPLVLAPAIPFIIIGNLIFVIMIDWFYQRAHSDFTGYWWGVLSGAFLKFVFLFLGVNLLATFLIKAPVITLVAQMLGWSQLITAILGGMIAWFILKFLRFFK